MVANVGQKIKFKNSQGNNFLMIPQSSDKTWECPPQIAAPADKKRFPTTTYYYKMTLYHLFLLGDRPFFTPALKSPHGFSPTQALPQARLPPSPLPNVAAAGPPASAATGPSTAR